MPGPLNRPARPPDTRRRPWGGAWTSRAIGGLPLPVADIPVTWLSDPLTLRLDQPLTHAEVTQDGGATARADSTTIGLYGAFPFTATLNTAVDADATNLAHWTVTYNSTPRMRSPSLTINLLYRTDAEKAYLLQIGRGRRIRLTGLPDEWPAGANYLVVRGIQHQATTFGRTITWVTGPVIGISATVQDAFATDSTNGWGSADTDQVWSSAGGAAADYFVSGGVGNHLHSAAGTLKESYVDTRSTDWDFSVDLSWPVSSASGATITRWICGRYTDSTNYYVCRLDLSTGGVVSMQLGQRTAAGVFTTLVSSTTVDATYVANSVYRVRFTGVTSTSGALTMAGRAWLPAIESDPATPLVTYQTTAPAVTSGTNVAVLDRAEAGNTNVPITLAWDNVAAYTGGNPQGLPGPWFRWDTSTWDGNDLRPF